MPINFDSIHSEFDGMMLNLCTECGGKCEKKEITMLLPGEAEFISSAISLSLQEFLDTHCNTLLFKEHEIYILKAGVCPFLDSEFRCALEKTNSKVVRCLLYPVIIHLSPTGEPEICLDTEFCPMAHRISEDFKTKAFAVYEKIKKDIPMWWLEFVTKYDETYYDYPKLELLRHKKILTLKELEACMEKPATIIQ